MPGKKRGKASKKSSKRKTSKKPDKELYKALQELDDTVESPEEEGRTLQRNWKGTLMIAAAGVVIVALLAVVYQQQQTMNDMTARYRELARETEGLRNQNAFYKKAYELTLDDIKTLSSNYGGQERYEQLAAELRQQELNETGTTPKAPVRAGIESETVWQAYVEAGIINTSCLPTFRADTVTDEVLITIDARGTFQVYVDANNLATVSGENESIIITLKEGRHAVDIVGEGDVERMRFDTTDLPVRNATADYGRQWDVFDCQDTETGSSLDGKGAVRFFVEKR